MSYERWLSYLRFGFPRLTTANSRVTSPEDEDYNCIAWAAETTDRWWWPDPQQQSFWPAGIPRIVSLDSFAGAYATLGYSQRTDSSWQVGSQKIAIFADTSGKPTHAARQLPGGWWASKLGTIIDIEHELNAVEGPVYGSVAIVLERMRP